MQSIAVEVTEDFLWGPVADATSPILSPATVHPPAQSSKCGYPNHWQQMCCTQTLSICPSRWSENCCLRDRCWSRSQCRGGRKQYQNQKGQRKTYYNKSIPLQQQQNSHCKQSTLRTLCLDPEEFVVQKFREIHWKALTRQSKKKPKVYMDTDRHSHTEVITDLHIQLPGRHPCDLLEVNIDGGARKL